MKKRFRRLISLIISVLLLCSCAPAVDAPTTSPSAAPDAAPAPTPAPTSELFGGGCTAEEIKYAQDHILDYFELYTLLNPGTDVHFAASDMGPNDDGYIEINCYGADIPDFESSGILPACVKLIYDPMCLEIAQSHPVPREPESSKTYEDGLTITMDREVYPLYPEYVSYTWSAVSDTVYGHSFLLYKYIDGDWQRVPGDYGFTLEAFMLHAGQSEKRTHYTDRATKLGEGLYRLDVSGDYPIEFAVSADAEPLESPDDASSKRSMIYQSNVFYKTGLPENVKNELVKHVYWPKEAPSYSTEFGFSMTNEEIAALLLADMHSYNASGNTYVSDCQTLSFENGLTLINTTPTARAMKLAYSFSPTLLTPLEFQEFGIRKGSNISSGWKSMEFHVPELWQLLDGCESFSGWEMPEDLVAFSLLNWELDEALERLRDSMSEEDFQEEYGDLADFGFRNQSGYGTRSYVYGHVNLCMPDAAQSVITDKSSSTFSGSEIYYTLAHGALQDLVIKDTPTGIRDNGDAAPIVPPYDAAAALLPELEKLEDEVSVISAEFAYAYHHGDTSTLRPTWIFTLTRRTTSPYDEKITVDNYSFLAVDAHTGKLLTE